MPKRRTPKQRAASRRNLEKARRARHSGIPTGKTSLLFHRTSESAANSIVREQKFRPNNKLNMDPPGKGTVFFSRPTAKGYGRYGKAIVGVKVSRKKVRKSGIDNDLMVKEYDLTGARIKRYR